MSQSPEFATTEAGGTQLQALHTLINCGWRYVTRAEADQWRDGRRTLPFLETQLRSDLARDQSHSPSTTAYMRSQRPTSTPLCADWRTAYLKGSCERMSG